MSKAQTTPSKVRRDGAAITEKQRQGRAANAIAELLMRKLLVPRTFLEPKPWIFAGESSTNPRSVDLIAFDRAGSGDIHIVEIKLSKADASPNERVLSSSIRTLLNEVPANFKYLAVDSRSVNFVSRQQLFANDGIGRIGIIEVIENPSEPPQAKIAVQAERFRLDQRWVKKFDD